MRKNAVFYIKNREGKKTGDGGSDFRPRFADFFEKADFGAKIKGFFKKMRRPILTAGKSALKTRAFKQISTSPMNVSKNAHFLDCIDNFRLSRKINMSVSCSKKYEHDSFDHIFF